MPSSSGIPESSIVFFVGGHNHDGESSTLIKTEQYSIYDWNIGVTAGSGQRGQRQDENAASFRLLIDSIVKETTLGPSGIRLTPNSITGIHIASNSITANELSANIILVNNVIRSNNFDGNVAANGSITSAGTAGWAISGDGSAVFDSSYIRGTITANSVGTPGIDILANGAIVSTNFNVTPQGNITATNASVSGTITASEIEASTFFIDSLNYWTSNGEFNVGTEGNFLSFDGTDLLLTGSVEATSGNIGGWSIVGENISAGNTVLTSTGVAQFGSSLSIGNNDIGGAEDIEATNIIKAGQFELQAGSMKGVFYTGTASSAGTGNFGFSFYWNGTNVYARLYNIANNTYQDVCLANCGAGGAGNPTPDPSPTTVVGTVVVGTVVTGTVVTGTVVVGEPPAVSPPSGCSPPCPDGFFCIDDSYCIG